MSPLRVVLLVVPVGTLLPVVLSL